jgi:hypothetical protein
VGGAWFVLAGIDLFQKPLDGILDHFDIRFAR